MIVTSIFGDEITIVFNKKTFVYRVAKPQQARAILKDMCNSQAFNWLDKNGTFIVTY